MKKTLIIGANSFLGLNIIKLLDDHDITGVYHKNTDKLVNTKIALLSVKEIFRLRDEFDFVYFISAFIPKGENNSDNEMLYKVNIELLQNCLSQFSLAKFIFASSVSVYGESASVLNENSQSKNVGNYGLSKLWGENLVRRHNSFAIFRISSMYGEGMNQGTFLPTIIKKALSEKQIYLYGNGERKQNYIHVSDVAEMMVNSESVEKNGTYLAVDSISHSNKQVADLIRSFLPEVNISYQGTDSSTSFEYDASYTYNHFGRPKIKLEIEIEHFIKWIKK